MADAVICPVCGETNAADMEFCRNCQSRLKPLTGALKQESGPIQPGDLPTKKVTSELEPLLPQWLRDARQQARDAAAEDASKGDEEEASAPISPASDLLAGLASQAREEEEEVPEWLAHITGTPSKKKKTVPEDNQVKWVELGRGDELQEPPLDQPGRAASATPAHGGEKDELSDWFKQAAASSDTADFRLPAAPPDAAPPMPGQANRPETPAALSPQADDLSWLRSLDTGTPSEMPPSAGAEPPIRDETPDWLKKLQAEQTQAEASQAQQAPVSPVRSEVPDWLRHFEEETPPVVGQEPPQPVTDQPLPDWLKSAEPSASQQAEQIPPEPPQQKPAIPTELPDWISALGRPEESAGATQPSAPASPSQPAQPQPASQEPAIPADLPDWIAALGQPEESAAATQPSSAIPPSEPLQAESASEEPILPVELPDWITALGQTEESAATTQPSSPASVSEPAQAESAREEPILPVELPDWMSALGQTQESAATTQPSSPAPASGPAQPTGEEPAMPSVLPDWLAALGQTQDSAAATQPSAPAFEPETASSKQPSMEEESPAAGAAFTEGVLQGSDVDAVFASMATPDWLTDIAPTQAPGGENIPPAAQQEEQAIGPAELPSWVQAMRPVESAISEGPEAAQPTPAEQRGPLAGLSGVLPAMPGAGIPSSKPKPHSIKLDASEQQQAHAALLERILAAETAPIPMRSGALLQSQRVLRWVISALVILLVGTVIFSGTQMFPLPSGVAGDEASQAIAAANAIPNGAPVLLVFDYQPSTVGEMEATGAPLVEKLLVMKQPHLALLSTSPTGSALAERFMTTALPLLKRPYLRDVDYVNLGYLPGGLAGVYNFAQHPSETVPLDANSRPVWQSAILGPVKRFSDFALVIVLTDSVEAGRSWIEQTASSRGSSVMIMAASAQAGPMLMPYVDSGQVNGMLSGIYGGATAEQDLGVRGLVYRYWDAYSVGLYVAVGLILLGGLWNLLLGIRDRRTQAVD